MPRERSRRDRRSSSYSSESSYDRKKSKSKHKRRSRSRDRSVSSSLKRRRSSSRSRQKRRSYSRSVSRDRYEKSRRRSLSRSRSRRDRSRSRSRSKYSKSSKKSKRSRSSSSRSSSFDIERATPSKKVNLDDTETKVEKAIRAAEAAGLTMTKLPSYEYKEVEVKEDMPSIHDRNLLAELNCDSFVQKPFTSSRSKKNIVIDLSADTVSLPDNEVKVQKDDCIIDLDELADEDDLREMWINKLYLYRKKMVKGEM